jgi:hypothetical protein
MAFPHGKRRKVNPVLHGITCSWSRSSSWFSGSWRSEAGTGSTLLNTTAVVFTIFVVAIVCLTRGAYEIDFASWVRVVRLGPINADDFNAELRQPLRRAGENVPVCSPSPEKYVFLSLFSGLQILHRDKERIQLDEAFWTQYKCCLFRLWQVLEIETLLRTGLPEGDVGLRDSRLGGRRATILRREEESRTLQFSAVYNLVDSRYARLSEKGPLSHNGCFIGPVAYPPQ